jgi:hypothetical protein
MTATAVAGVCPHCLRYLCRVGEHPECSPARTRHPQRRNGYVDATPILEHFGALHPIAHGAASDRYRELTKGEQRIIGRARDDGQIRLRLADEILTRIGDVHLLSIWWGDA